VFLSTWLNQSTLSMLSILSMQSTSSTRSTLHLPRPQCHSVRRARPPSDQVCAARVVSVPQGQAALSEEILIVEPQFF